MRVGVMMAVAMLAARGVEAKQPVQTISYATGACHGTCPAYKVTVSSDGHGIFEGERYTAVTGRRAFRVTPAQWRAFRARLQALHGHGTVDLTGPPLCTAMATDMADVEVRWSGAWRPFVLRANYGCRTARQGGVFARLRRAPEVLPIAGLIGRH